MIENHFDTVPILKGAFGEFPQIATNDFTIDQLNHLRAAEDNLNANSENLDLAKRYLMTVSDISQKLTDEYKDYFKNPFKLEDA